MLWLTVSIGAVFLLILVVLLFLQRLINQKKRFAEQQVAQLEQQQQLIATRAVLDGETTERARLARDLHDGLGGMLSAVKFNLHDMKQGTTLEPDDVARFDKAMGMLDESINELRRVAHNMMPESLSRYGLKTALDDFCSSVSNVHFHYFGSEIRLDRSLEIVLYRTILELVNNAIKHSGAENIHVQIIQEPDRIALNVQDDGKGFDTHLETGGTGLKNIRNRVESFNGSFEVYSKPGTGTEITAEFELQKNSYD
jgi:signal transduction histidine kinase